MKRIHTRNRRQQRGIVSVMAVVFLIAAVLFVLMQTLNQSGSASADDKQQHDSTVALFLAESGLERANAILAAAAKGVFTQANCCVGTGCSLPSGAQTLGGGSYTFTSATPSTVTNPSATTCGGSGNPACTACSVVVTGAKGNASRQISRGFNIVELPAYCNTANTADCSNQLAVGATPATWSFTLDKYTAPAYMGIGVFNLATVIGPTYAASAGLADCFSGAAGCLEPSKTPDLPDWRAHYGVTNSVFGLGHTVAQQTSDTTVYQRLSDPHNDVAITGVLFPGSYAAGSVIGAYPPGNPAFGGSTVTAQTSNGGITGAWCDDRDAVPVLDGRKNALVMGFSAHSTSAKTDTLSSVRFDNRSGTNGVPLTQVMKAPTTDSGYSDAADTVYSEIWYASNYPYSSGKWITGKVLPLPVTIAWKLDKAVLPTGAAIVNGTQQAFIGVGDPVSNEGCPSTPFLPDTHINAFGPLCNDYAPGPRQAVDGLVACFDKTPTNNANSCVGGLVSGTNVVKLEVTQVNGGTNAADIDTIVYGASGGDTIVGPGLAANTTILNKLTTDTGYVATYQISWPAAAPATTTFETMIVGGASTSTVSGVTTVTVASGTPLPRAGTIVQLRNLYAGSGSFDTYSVATPVGGSTTQFTLSQAALTNSAARGAVVCGGTCALFNQTPTGSTTQFRVATGALPTGTDNWTAGFVCLRNVGTPTTLTGHAGAKVTLGTWGEVVK